MSSPNTSASLQQQAVNPWLVAFIVSIATFMEVLDTTITNVSLSHISGSLGASYDESTWVLTSYLVANGIVIPISGWLSGILGRKNYFMICIACFTLASFACGAATSLPMLVFFRLIQGMAGGGLQPVQQAIILDAFPPSQRAAAFGITSITMIIAPILGPTLGGWITDNFVWRWIFYINVPVGIAAFLLASRFIFDAPESKFNGNKSIDYIGISLVALGLGSLQIVLDKGQQDDWFHSNFVIFFAVICVSCIGVAIYWLLKQENPLINLRLLKDHGFRMSCLLIFITGFFLYSCSMIIPLMVQTQLGYTSLLAGLVISPGGVVVLLIIPFMGRLLSIFSAKTLIIFGFALASLGMFFSAGITTGIDFNTLVWIRIGQVVCLPFLFVPISTVAFSNIPKDQNNKASALYSMARNLGGSIGIALTATYIIRTQQSNQSHLAEHLIGIDGNIQGTIDGISRTLMDGGYDASSASEMAMSQVYQQLVTQSSFLSYQNAFYLLFFIGIFAMVFAIFLPKSNSKAVADPSVQH